MTLRKYRQTENQFNNLHQAHSTTKQLRMSRTNQATAPMYIINPLTKKGMSASDLTSTHPPIADRIRILRAMGGASLADYELAYQQTKGKGGIIPPSALTGAVPIRKASDDIRTMSSD